MYEINIDTIDALSGTNNTDRRKLFAWLAKQPDGVRIESLKIQRDLIRQNIEKKNSANKNEFYYSFLVKSITMMLNKELKLKRKTNEEKAEPDNTIFWRDVARASQTKKKRQAKLAKRIKTGYIQELIKLRTAGLSYRSLSLHMKKKHKISISAMYLSKIIKDSIKGYTDG
jgi:hypothetical protein